MRRPATWRRVAVVVLGVCLVAAGGLSVGAARRRAATVALAQLVEAAEARADLLEGRGALDEAARALDEALTGPWPAAVDPAVGRPLRAALLGRWARLRLDAGDPDVRAAVRRRIEAHLEARGADGGDEDAFTARLYAILGEIYEAEGRDDEALAAYQTALAMNRALLERLLEDDAQVP